MGCCLFALLLAGAPRLAFLLWWLVQPVRMEQTFTTFIWPLVGVIFAPWTTVMYVLVYPAGIKGFDYLWLGLAIAVDVGTYVGNGRARQQQNAAKKAAAAKAVTAAQPMPPTQPAAPVSAPPAAAPAAPEVPAEPQMPSEPEPPMGSDTQP